MTPPDTAAPTRAPAFEPIHLGALAEAARSGAPPRTLREGPLTIELHAWSPQHPLTLPDADAGVTHVVLAVAAGAALRGSLADVWHVRPGMFAVEPGPVAIDGGAGLVLRVLGHRGQRQLGGPLEPTGRLRYVDGCTDTLLVCPPRRGEPCLNHLHIPAGTRQSAHTHPSVRVGVISRGAGTCVTDAGATALHAGLAWVIPAGLRHSFHTADHSLDVIAWHPDSDFGPTDADHPMINRTVLVTSDRGPRLGS